MDREPKVWSPLWLEHSGLPRLVQSSVKGGHGWTVFKKVVELDCAVHREPEAVEITLVDLGELIGIDGGAVRKVVQSLRKLRLLACFLPETDEEPALLKVRAPLETPISKAEVLAKHPMLFPEGSYFRYLDEAPSAADTSEVTAEDTDFQEIVDLYFDAIGLKMNSFVLDELRLVRERFTMKHVRSIFRRAKKNEIRSLSWIVSQLAREASRDKKEADGGKTN